MHFWIQKGHFRPKGGVHFYYLGSSAIPLSDSSPSARLRIDNTSFHDSLPLGAQCVWACRLPVVECFLVKETELRVQQLVQLVNTTSNNQTQDN